MYQYTLTPKDKYIVLSSDGLTEFLSNKDIGDLIQNSKDINVNSLIECLGCLK